MDGFQTDGAGGLWVEQEAGASGRLVLDFYSDLTSGDTIGSAVWSSDTGISLSGQGTTATTASAIIAGSVGGWFLVKCTVVTVGGETLVKSFRINITQPAQLGAGIVSAFPSLPAAVAQIRRDRLLSAASNFFPDTPLSDEYLLEKVVAAEASAQRELRCFFTPHEMLPEGADQSEIDALTQAGNVVTIEPGYDYDPAFFQGNTWGLIEVRQKPIIAVHSIKFAYPSPDNTLYDIPIQWVRMDAKYGRINLVPVQTTLMLPLNAFLLSALGGGRLVPLMLQVRYRCGLANAASDFPDLLDVLKKMTVLSIIEDNYTPASGSTSADGLSQTVAVDTAKYQQVIDRRVKVLRDAIHGIRIMVM